MKRYLLAVILGCLYSASFAQGYVGAVRSLTNIGLNCVGSEGCDKSSKGWRFYAGTKLEAKNVLDFGIGKVDALEVSYMRFGPARSSGSRAGTAYVYDQLGNGSVVPVTQSLRYVSQADAIAIAAVANMPVQDQLSISARLGVAYVSSTFRSYVDDHSDISQTKSKIKPYIGMGVAYDIPSIVKLVGTFDMTKYDVGGYSGSMRMIGLGAEKTF